jgi:hypothetical protein
MYRSSENLQMEAAIAPSEMSTGRASMASTPMPGLD